MYNMHDYKQTEWKTETLNFCTLSLAQSAWGMHAHCWWPLVKVIIQEYNLTKQLYIQALWESAVLKWSLWPRVKAFSLIDWLTNCFHLLHLWLCISLWSLVSVLVGAHWSKRLDGVIQHGNCSVPPAAVLAGCRREAGSNCGRDTSTMLFLIQEQCQ